MNQRVLVTIYARKNLSSLPDDIKEEFFREIKIFHKMAEKDPRKFLFSDSSTKKNESGLIMTNQTDDTPIYSLKLGSYNALITIHENMTIIHAVIKSPAN